MLIGLIGRGHWGNVYAKTLDKMGVPYRQMGKDWSIEGLDGVIIASSPDSHFILAKAMILARMPVLIEKPICFSYKKAMRLVSWTGDKSIVFAGHTRLYSPAWKEFKSSLPEIVSIKAQAGGVSKIDQKWDWGPHLVSMCLDLGFPPDKADIRLLNDLVPLTFVVNDAYRFQDVITDPMPLEVLLTEFIKAIKSGEKDIRGLEFGVEVTAYCEVM